MLQGGSRFGAVHPKAGLLFHADFHSWGIRCWGSRTLTGVSALARRLRCEGVPMVTAGRRYES
jgi:hypothetical protein